jgi:N-acyl-D-amino-acid deacylase
MDHNMSLEETMNDLIIKGGTVVDGTGAPSVRADVRVRGGVIVEVGADLVIDKEPVIDAGGAFVIPGIIDNHTHFDGAMWWDGGLEPLPGSGNTSMVFGNCGNSLAPLSPGQQRDGIVDLLCFLEDLPLEAFHQLVPWNWERWPDYVDAMSRQPTSVHVGGYCGHLALRSYVMGEAAWERAATAAEIDQMCAILDESLQAGAMGLSFNFFDKDRQLRLVPGYFAADDELVALFGVVARRRPATVQCITRFNDPEGAIEDALRIGAIAKATGVRVMWPGIPMSMRDTEYRPAMWDIHHELQAGGADMWPMVPLKPLSVFYSFERSINFQRVPAWHELINGPADEKARLLADPDWRAKARSDWDGRTRSTLSNLDYPETLTLAISENGPGPVGITLPEFAEQTGLHISDALAEWLVRNGVGSLMRSAPMALAEDDVCRAIKEPRTMPNINDSGAHAQLFAAAGEHMYLLTQYVRDTGQLTIEEGVHALTGRSAAFFGLNDRGVIAPGKVADLAVFALDEIRVGPEQRRYDVPFGTWRLVREPAGFRATICAGEPTWLDGAQTDARPGRQLRPSAS